MSQSTTPVLPDVPIPIDDTTARLPTAQTVIRRRASTSAEDTWFIQNMARYSPSYLLQNKGATARDHLGSIERFHSHSNNLLVPYLANERTFLAYMRTSLSLLTVGVAVIQLYRLTSTSTTIHSATESALAKSCGLLFVVLGLCFILFGAMRYFYAQNLMVKGLFPASRGSIVFGSFFLAIITIVVFIITLVYL